MLQPEINQNQTQLEHSKLTLTFTCLIILLLNTVVAPVGTHSDARGRRVAVPVRSVAHAVDESVSELLSGCQHLI